MATEAKKGIVESLIECPMSEMRSSIEEMVTERMTTENEKLRSSLRELTEKMEHMRKKDDEMLTRENEKMANMTRENDKLRSSLRELTEKMEHMRKEDDEMLTEKMKKMQMENEKLYTCVGEMMTLLGGSDPFQIHQQEDHAKLQEHFEVVSARSASMVKGAERMLEEFRQCKTKVAQPSPRIVELKEEILQNMAKVDGIFAKLKMFLSSVPEPSPPQVETQQQQQQQQDTSTSIVEMTFEERFEEMEFQDLEDMVADKDISQASLKF